MRVALNFTSIGARRGGAETYVGVLARSLSASGHEVHVLAESVDSGELPSDARIHQIKTRRWPGLRWLRPYQFAAASARELARDQFDLVIGFSHVWRQDVCVAINGCRPALLANSGQRFRSAAKRLAWRLGKLLSPKQWMLRWIEHKQFGHGDPPFVIAPSHRVAEDFRRWHQIDERRMAVVHLGIELDEGRTTPRARQAFRQQRGLMGENVAILFAARNYSLKGLEPLLEAFAPVARSCPTAQLLVCGARNDTRYRRLARRLAVADRVQFLGVVDNIGACFAGVDVFAMPSFYDACSLVVLEALAAGVPVVTTRANGAAELVSDGSDGYVIDSPWNVDQLSERLTRLVNDQPLREQMSRRARAGCARLSIESSVQKMLAVLADARSLSSQASRSLAA